MKTDNNDEMFHFWATFLSGFWKIMFTTFIPILVWTSQMKLAKRIIHFLNIPGQMVPLFFTAILVGVPGMFLYVGVMYTFRKCKINLSFLVNGRPFSGEFTNGGNEDYYSYDQQSVSVRITLIRLAPVAFTIMKLLKLKLILFVDPKLAIIKMPNGNSNVESAFHMNKKGELELDITKKVKSVKSTGSEFQETLVISPIDNINPGKCNVVLRHGRNKIMGWCFTVEIQNGNIELGE